jgi:hypothetical protein
MMRLCPIKYGVKVVPSEGRWLLVGTEGRRVGTFDGVWTELVNESLVTGHLYTTGDYAYFKIGGTGTVSYAELSDLATWTSMGSVSASSVNGQMASDGTYLYIATGTQPFGRALLPTGSATNYGASSVADSLLCANSAIYGLYSDNIERSTDSGLTFTQLNSNWDGAGGPVGQTGVAINDSGRVVIFANNSVGPVLSSYTDDYFTTLSANVTIDTVVSQGAAYRCLVWDGVYFVGVLETGECYRSTDGDSWAKSTIPSTTVNSINHGGGRLMVVDASNQIFSSDDHGATWSSFPVPDGSGTSYTDIIYLP